MTENSVAVWVYPDFQDELRRYDNIICYAKQGGDRRVRAWLKQESVDEAGHTAPLADALREIQQAIADPSRDTITATENKIGWIAHHALKQYDSDHNLARVSRLVDLRQPHNRKSGCVDASTTPPSSSSRQEK